jgi:hypothetical protein
MSKRPSGASIIGSPRAELAGCRWPGTVSVADHQHWEGLFAKTDVPADLLAKVRSVSQEIASVPSYLKAMEPTGMEHGRFRSTSFKPTSTMKTKAFGRDVQRYKLKLE